jgi:uncharacterized protein (TIGR03083 family)
LPMELTRDRMLAIARAEREALGRTVQYTPPDRWEAESPAEGWRVKDVLAHLAASDVAAASVVAGETLDEVQEYRKTLEPGTPLSGDGFNDWSVARRAETPVHSLALEWGRAADLFLARVAEATDEEWFEKEVAWITADLRLRYLVMVRVAEWYGHGEDIREGAALPPRLEHFPIYVVNDLSIRMLPYSLSLAGHSFPGKTVEIELHAEGEGTWRRRLDASIEESPKGGRPDAYIIGRGYAFASVANGRADPDVCLYEGLLNVGGRVDIAEAVLRSLRSFP